MRLTGSLVAALAATAAVSILAGGSWQLLDLSTAQIASGKAGYPRERDHDEEHERGRYDEPEAFARMWEARREGTGKFSPAQINYAFTQQIAARGTSAAIPAWGFQEMGPGNFGGRSRGLLVHASNTNRLLFSSVSGGLWRS